MNRKNIILSILAVVLLGCCFMVGRQTAPRHAEPDLALKQTIAVLEDQRRQLINERAELMQKANYLLQSANQTQETRTIYQNIYHEKATTTYAAPVMQQSDIFANQLNRLDSITGTRKR